MLLLVTKPTY